MMQQIDVYVKLTFEADATLTTEQLHEKYSEMVIAGCQVFAEDITAPVEIMDIKEEAQIRDEVLITIDLKQELDARGIIAADMDDCLFKMQCNIEQHLESYFIDILDNNDVEYTTVDEVAL
ncbi:MAG: hypothetical protein V4721_00575 [Bacteroidota bacterium]